MGLYCRAGLIRAKGDVKVWQNLRQRLSDHLQIDSALRRDVRSEIQLDAELFELNGDHWRAPNAHVGDGAELAEAGRAQGVDALIAKRVVSSYTPGSTSADWITVAL